MSREVEIKELKDHFKNREEVEKFFGGEQFKFTFMSEGTIFFETLNPIYVNEELHSFQIAFYNNDRNDFFAYSSFNDWLGGFQLQEVEIESEENHKRTKMYFDTWAEGWELKK